MTGEPPERLREARKQIQIARDEDLDEANDRALSVAETLINGVLADTHRLLDAEPARQTLDEGHERTQEGEE